MNAYMVCCDMIVLKYNSHTMRRMVVMANNIDDACDLAKNFWEKVKKDSEEVFTFDNFEANLLNYGEIMLDNGNFFVPYCKNGEIIEFDEFT